MLAYQTTLTAYACSWFAAIMLAGLVACAKNSEEAAAAEMKQPTAVASEKETRTAALKSRSPSSPAL